MTDHDWDNPITCEFVGAQPPEHPNGENIVSSTALPEKLIRTVTAAYVIALRRGDLHAALGLMTQLADRYGLVAVRGLAAELAMDLHIHCPSRFRTAFGGANLSALAPAADDDALTTLDVASKTNRLMGRGQVTAADLEDTEVQMRVTETVRHAVQAALNAAAGQSSSATAAQLGALTTPRELSAAVALLTNGLRAVLP
ncbi:hypothetical protein QCN29_23170 [Streptomyces sp. HNM0663]|uniref:Uncharacterized protein n=1 Tax=Streptomyces chengmaiensis TaxID=3040919 RepID=A0ABT6HSE2_9ACTN|nr:hypothetical protein [Streptomyces chengmaiensis]MDH2391627.1 hypothetical protein [Streptomyces chengmaiensis]